MSSEFNIHNDVNQLMKLLEIEDNVSEGVTADAITENLVKSVDQKSKTRGAKDTFVRKLEVQSDPDFKNKYEDLKIHNVIELDPFVHLLARINDENKIKYLLKLQNKSAAKKLSQKSVTDKTDNLTPLTKTHVSTASSDRHSFHSAVSQQMHETNATEVNGISNTIDGYLDNRTVRTPQTQDMSSKRKDKRHKMCDWKFLTFDYQFNDWSQDIMIQPLSSLSVPEQESALIEDLLFLLIGIEGKYIRLHQLKDKPSKNEINVDKSGDELLYTLAVRITALCPYYSQIIHFIDTIDNGLVNQALVAAMRAQIKDFFTLISQLETQHRKGDLTLQKMWYYLQPSFTNLGILKDIASKILKGNLYGGAVLSILHDKTISLSGNTKAQDFCLSITRKASEPYFEILETWIYEGIIDDPYKEFLVEDKADQCDAPIDDQFWENRYEVIRSRIPVFFERQSDLIMKTGKYLSVIRNCGRQITRPNPPQPLVYTTEERVYIENIEIANNFASKELLHLLVDELDLIGRLKSIKHYFFMDFGDFIVQFMDLAADELEKEIDDIVINRLESLLELSLRTSLMNYDPYKDDVHIELLNDSLHSQMSQILNIGSNSSSNNSISEPYNLRGSEALALKFTVLWPLSLIISTKNITCYQMLFRHLFYCKYVERQLEEVWKGNKIAKRYTLKAITGYGQAFALRQKMLNFVQNLEYYIMLEVIEPTFHQFLDYVQTKVSSVDEMMKSHDDYIQKCLCDAMLTSGELLRAIVQLLRLCIIFSNFMKDSQSHSTQYELLDTSNNLDKIFENNSEGVSVNINDSKELQTSFEDHISAMHSDFNTTLHQLLEAIKLQTQESFTMLPVLNRLDFNGFYQSLELNSDQ